jgi:hypothetical protein
LSKARVPLVQDGAAVRSNEPCPNVVFTIKSEEEAEKKEGEGRMLRAVLGEERGKHIRAAVPASPGLNADGGLGSVEISTSEAGFIEEVDLRMITRKTKRNKK